MTSDPLKKNFLYNAAYQVLLVITPLITTPWLSRTIGAEGNGIFTYTQSIINYFVMVSVLGLSNYGVRVIAECGDDRALRSRTFWEVITMSVGVGLLVLVAYILYVAFFGSTYLLCWVCWGLWVIGSVADTSWLFFGMQEFRMPTIRNFITKLISVLTILLFVHTESDTWIYVLAISGAYLLNSILLWPFVSHYVDFVRPSTKGVLAPKAQPSFVHPGYCRKPLNLA
jgi:O-antigen/teichoic acid export membrane protein